ncbi:MAG: RNA polymerase primary sigma factor, partial [Candidatus Krumholzibacteriia bacterium]
KATAKATAKAKASTKSTAKAKTAAKSKVTAKGKGTAKATKAAKTKIKASSKAKASSKSKAAKGRAKGKTDVSAPAAQLMSNLDLYFQEVKAYSLLTRAEECELARGIHANDSVSLHKLVKANLRFVVSIAKEYAHYGVPLEDLINEGNLGLLKAAQRFDETRGFKFISYAVWWIRQSILAALANHSKIVRMPLNRARVLNQIKKASGELQQKLRRKPEAEEIAKVLGLSVDEVKDTLPLMQDNFFLDDFVGNDEDSTYLDFLEDTTSDGPDNKVMDDDLNSSIGRMLGDLKTREAKVLKLYYGLGSDEEMTLEEIGQIMGLTRERIRQIKEEAFDKIRSSKTFKYMHDYSEEAQI